MRAWSLIALGDDRQYGGNIGYEDDPKSIYRYDSSVANAANIAAGDLVFIRDATSVIGLATVEEVRASLSLKKRRRCPTCATTGIKERETMQPRWRCKIGHVFDDPVIDEARVTGYEAFYGNTYQAAPPGISARVLKEAALRPNDQLAIEEVGPAVLERVFTGAAPRLFQLFVARAEHERPLPDDGHENDPDITASDNRTTVLRSTKLRRGQRKFRLDLKRRYGAACMVSGCSLFDIVEAAHIWPQQGDESNNLRNGLLLRADMHTLFDLYLMGIDPVLLTAHFHPSALAAGYEKFEGRMLRITDRHRPAQNVLKDRWDAFQEALTRPAPSRPDRA